MKNIELKAPMCWEELTAEQVAFVGKQYVIGVDREEFLTRCFLKFTGVKLLKRYPSKNDQGADVFEFKYKGVRFSLPADEFAAFCGQLAYLLDNIGLMPCPEKISGFICPDAQLYNHTLEEFLMADKYYILFSQTKCDGLDELIATLYRSKNEAYTDLGTEKRLAKVRKANRYVKYAVYLWYTGCKSWIKQKYPFVFGEPDEVNDVPADELIFGLLESINNGKPHDNERILKTHVHEVLYSLNHKIEQANKLNKK